MVNRRISPDIKECALRLWELEWDRSAICSTLLVSQSSLYRWAKIFDEFGAVTPPPPPIMGRPQTIELAALSAIKDIYTRHADTCLFELRWWLAIHHDIQISISALQQSLDRTGLTRKLLHKIAVEREVERRRDFLYTIQHKFSGTGREFVTIDESSKNEHDVAPRYGRAPIGMPADFEDVFVRGVCYTLVAAMGIDGYIAQRVIEGSLDSFGFFDFIVEEVPEMGVFPDDCSVLVMDNCRIHHMETLQETLNAQGIMLMYLPPYSPDLNPIEESFSTWKAHLRANVRSIRAADDPILILLESTGCITPAKARAWFHHAG
ncbi:Tc1-mariner class transposase [Mycena venus]|uniref:Tc1-mariner class transposase n=1 Tax=Mycena venus TaxID=2733690 RepID=A0A8H6Z6I9_9AGAR|nr:Tc1-mariner class transposase [Mycena venus]